MKKQNYEILKRIAASECLYIDEVKGGILCLRGLSSWDQAKKISSANPQMHLEATIIHRRADEYFWYIVGRAYAPLEITAADFGENYAVYKKDDAKIFELNCLSFLPDLGSLEAAAEYAAKAAVTLEKIKDLQPGQIVVAYCDEYEQTTDERTMEFSTDSNIWEVALVAYDD